MTMKQARRQHRQYMKKGGKLSLKAWIRSELHGVNDTFMHKLGYLVLRSL